MRINIEVDEAYRKSLEKRAEKNYLSMKEMIEDIIRRSMMSYVGKPAQKKLKVDDKLVMAFSRDRRGRK